MAWLEAHQELRDHPKTKRAARALNIARPQMIGHMLCLWWWCLDYADDGDLSDYDNADIADAAEWEGDPDTFVSALLNCGPSNRPGFLVTRDSGLSVNDWQEYGGKFIAKRNQSKDRQARHRERNAPSNAGVTPGNALVTRDRSVSNGATEENSTEDKITKEERTEDKITQQYITEQAPTPLAAGEQPATNGKSARFVDPVSFLSLIGYKNPDSLLQKADETLIAKWAFYYQCLTPQQRQAVKSWPALINDRVSSNTPPRLNGEQSARFYREWSN